MSKKPYQFRFGRGSRIFRFIKKSMLLWAIVACLLPQTLLAAVSSDVTDGVLTVTSDAADNIAVTCDGGNVKVNGADPDSGAALCDSIIAIDVLGGPGENEIDLSAVTSISYTALLTVTVDGAEDNDVITGTTIADTLQGGPGDDTLNGNDGDDILIGNQGADIMNGDAGNDTMIWNPGDGSDVADGGDGDDTVIVNGGGVSETFVISGTATGVFFERLDPAPFFVDIISPTEQLILNANGGADIVTGTTGLAGVILLTVNGGDGDDQITGGDGNDVLNGDDGNDTLIGFRGADEMNGGPGDDILIWNPGDGSDVARGEDGDDIVIVNGGGVSETFVISGTATGVFFERTSPAPFFVDIISPTEQLILNANGGGDIVTGTTGLAGVILLTVNGGDGDDHITGGDGNDILNGDGGNDTLVGFRGADEMNGGPGDDTLIWNPGDGSDVARGEAGNDTVIVNGGGVSETFTISATATGALFERVSPAPFFVDIISPTENLLLNANGGGDIITGSVGLNGVITLTLNGGPGDDLIRGGDGPDTLNGDEGDDTLIGFRGADIMRGGDGDDMMIWNNGDGSDIMDGGPGNDTSVVNGSPADETFTISQTTSLNAAGLNAPTQGSVLFRRLNPGPFSIDIESENVEVNGNDGNDTLTAQPLDGTNIFFNGGSQTVADILRVNALGAAVHTVLNQILAEGKAPITIADVEQVEIEDEAFPIDLYMPLLWDWNGPGS
jgi:Ca2+-binding RTX toxin-like protein